MSDPITQSMMSSEDDLLCKFFRDALVGCLAALLARNVSVLPDASGGTEDSLWFQADFAPIPDGRLAFGGDRPSWLGLGKQLLAAPSNAREDADESLILSTLQETSAQVMRSMASALTVRLGHDLSAKILPPATTLVAAANGYHATRFRIGIQDLPEVQAVFLVSPQLQDLVGTKEVPRNSDLPINTKNLELLMDVEMPVSISFGRAQLALKDVIKLTTGSIVELNRSISEPVDIIVNNCTVARGEVVVVEGNFGVRIKGVLSKEDRLKKLG
jgi:flagellar motor switch protein FliN